MSRATERIDDSHVKARILKWVRWILLVWGGISFLCVIAFGVYGAFIVYSLEHGSSDQNDRATSRDVRFVLNWCQLGEERIESVVHSHVSARSFTGDHLDAYAIKISHIDPAELTSKTNDPSARWYRGDQLSEIVDGAVKFTGGWNQAEKIPWFPTEKELRSEKYYVYPWGIYYHGTIPMEVQLIFICPADKMVFYFDCKM